MKIFGIIVLYLLIGIVDFFGLAFVLFLVDELHKSVSFKEALKQSLIGACKELQELNLSDSSDIIMPIMIIIVWPLILFCEIIIVPCILCVYGIKRIAELVLDKMTKSETKDENIKTEVSAKEKKTDETDKKYKKDKSPKPPKNTKSVRDPGYDPGEVTLKTSEVDNPSRKRVKKIKKVNIK